MSGQWSWAEQQREALKAERSAMIREIIVRRLVSPPLINFSGHFISMAQVYDDGDGRGQYALDSQNRRWLLDGSGDVA